MGDERGGGTDAGRVANYETARDAAQALARQSLMHYSEPWRALAFVLEQRNFENERLRWEVERLRHIAAAARAWREAGERLDTRVREGCSADERNLLREQVASRALELRDQLRAEE